MNDDQIDDWMLKNAEWTDQLGSAVAVDKVRGILAALPNPSDKQEAVLPEVEQDWAKVEPSVAFHLIERHAEDWAHAGRMMEAWRAATTAAPLSNPSDKQEAVALWAAFDAQGALLAHSKLRPGLSDILNWEPLYRATPLAQSAEQDRIDAEYREVGVWDTDGRKFRTYAAENLNGKAMYVRDAAMQADKEKQ